MYNEREAGQYGEFNFLFMEPIKNIKIISDLCPSDRILVCDELGVNTLQKYYFIRKRVPVVMDIIEVEGILVVDHYYLWGAWIYRKFWRHDVIIELGHHLLYNCFGVHILTLMNILDILELHDIPWAQEKSEPVVVFCWWWNVKKRRKDSDDIVVYLMPYIEMDIN